MSEPIDQAEAERHRAISAAKHLPPARLLPRLGELRQRLAEYRPALSALRMPVGTETVALIDPSAAS